jgi:hypothetical protein
MKSTSIDTVLEVRLRHELGTLARVAAAIADHQGLRCEDRGREPPRSEDGARSTHGLHDRLVDDVHRAATPSS